MNTLPTVEWMSGALAAARGNAHRSTDRVLGFWGTDATAEALPSPATFALVEQPDGLVLVREDCGTCHGSGVESCPHGLMEEHGGDEHLQPCPGAGLCPDCLGVPLLAWYRVCDQCDNGERVVTIQTTIEPARREDFGPCRNCVGVDGRSLVKVRRNP